jgi:hypothetical protein
MNDMSRKGRHFSQKPLTLPYSSLNQVEIIFMKKCGLSVCILVIWLITLILQSVAFAEGRFEHLQITSKILADAGQPSDKEISIYLPEEYDTSELAYPVLYLIHALSDLGNRTWFTYGADFLLSLFDELPAPLIIVMPSMGKTVRIVQLEEAHLIEEVIPFVEGKYRIIPYREGRAIAGHSRGGGDAFHIVLSHPELFSIAGGISAGGARALPSRAQLEAHDQELYPLQFWLAYGLNEGLMTIDNLRFVSILKELGIPCINVEDDGTHGEFMAKGRHTGCLEFISRTLGGGVVSVEPYGKYVRMWGNAKSSE